LDKRFWASDLSHIKIWASRTSEDLTVLFDTRRGNTHVVSIDALEILRLCHGAKVGFGQILSYLKACYPEEAIDDLEEFASSSIATLTCYGLLDEYDSTLEN